MPRLDTILKVAGGLSVPPAELLEGMAWQPAALVPGRFEEAGQ
jgi:hypothetical protein